MNIVIAEHKWKFKSIKFSNFGIIVDLKKNLLGYIFIFIHVH